MIFSTDIYLAGTAVTGSGSLSETVAAGKVSPRVGDLDAWVAAQSLAKKDLKLADRQTLLLYRTLKTLLEEHQPLDRTQGPIHVAVGPAQSDVESMRSWAERIDGPGPYPMIQPAGAIGLLPNTPLSWVSIRLGLKGENSVWGGFAEAGFAAVFAGIRAVLQGSPASLVAAVTSPENYFVQSSIARSGISFPGALVEMGVALLLSRESTPLRLKGIRFFPSDTPAETIFVTLAGESLITRELLETQAVIDGCLDRRDISDSWGESLPAKLPFALGLATHGWFGSGPRLFICGGAGPGIAAVLVEIA